MDFLENTTVYNLDDTSKYLLDLAYKNRDTEKGYRTYYALEKYIKDNHKDDTILYDLGAEFAPDDKLDIEVSKLARSEHRFDMISEEAMKLVGYAVKLTRKDGATRFKLKTGIVVTEDYLYDEDVSNSLYLEGDIEFECKYLNSANKFVAESNSRDINFVATPFPVYQLI